MFLQILCFSCWWISCRWAQAGCASQGLLFQLLLCSWAVWGMPGASLLECGGGNRHQGRGWTLPDPKGPGQPHYCAQQLLLFLIWGCQQGPSVLRCAGQSGTSPAPSLLGLEHEELCLSPPQSPWDRKGSVEESRKCCPAGARISL